MNIKNTINNIKTNQVKLYKNSMPKVTYFMICLLLIGLYLSSCTGKKLDDGGTAPIIDYDPLGISSFSVVDENDVPISDTNAIPFDISFSFLLTFDQSLGNMADHVSSLANQITLTGNTGNGILPLPFLKVEPTQTPNQVKITSAIYLGGGITYQLTLKKGLTVNNYQTTNDITYLITTKKNSDSSLIVIYDSKEFFPNGNDIPILLPIGSDPSSVTLTLKVGEGASLQQGNNNLPLNENNQYTTNVDFSGNATHSFTVTAQDESTSVTYTIRVLQRQMDSKEIISFAFRETDNSLLKENIAMDIDSNNRAITKTVTNVEGITGLVPTIVHSGSNISPASGVAQDFSTAKIYMVTAIDGSTSDYTVTLTGYYGVIFNANGGLISGDPTVTKYILYGEKATQPSDPSQEHYGFKGWYNAITGGNVFDFTTTDITTQTIVYAQWTNKQYRVRFYRGTKLLDTVSVASLTEIPAINYPVHPIPGQTYEWHSDNNLTQLYNKSFMVDGNLDLYTPISDFQKIIDAGTIPSDLANYDDMNELIFSNYTPGTTVVARYVKEVASGTSDGSSWDNATNDIQTVIDGIVDASENRVYVVLVASGTYSPSSSYVMKNHIALVGGFFADSYDQLGETRLDGNNNQQVFNNNDLDRTALLYGVVITNGNANNGSGGGMVNNNSSPTLINITFSGNTARYGHGGGMRNVNSSPTLINVTFSNNESRWGGGMRNNNSSPTLIDVTFLNNKIDFGKGGGMYNANSSSPILINVTFLNNSSTGSTGNGGGIANEDASPVLNNVTFSGNTTHGSGGGMYNGNASLTLINVTFSDNTAGKGSGGGIANRKSSLTLNNVTFLNNESRWGGGMHNSNSFSSLNNVTFSGNRAIALDEYGGYGGGMRNYSSSSTLINVTFSGNQAADKGGGLANSKNSFPTLINVIFSGNEANQGGGIANEDSFPTLINVTFSGNEANQGGGIYHDGDSQPLTLINTILWDNDGENIYLRNDNADTETVNLYYSVIEGGVNLSTTATGIRLRNADTSTYPVVINSGEVITGDPELGFLASYGGKINTISIGSSSPAKDKGVYVWGVKAGNTNTYSEADLYYSINNTDWYSDPSLISSVPLPNDADDLTATDARGYGRVGRPDMGAYEAGGIEP